MNSGSFSQMTLSCQCAICTFIQQSFRTGVVTSFACRPLTTVTYEEYATQVQDALIYGFYECFNFQLNNVT